METQQQLRRSKLKVAVIGFAFTIVGGATMKMGKILVPVLDADGNQTYRADGTIVAKFDQWENFKYNGMSHTINVIGLGAIAWGIGSWVYVGLRHRRETNPATTRRWRSTPFALGVCF